jgi:hypothetical protein
MISVEREKELQNLVSIMIEEGNDAMEIIASVKTAIIEAMYAININKKPPIW